MSEVRAARPAWGRRIRDWWRDYQWPLVGVATGIAFLLTWRGLLLERLDTEPPAAAGVRVVDALYRALRVFGIGRPGMSERALGWHLELARWLLVGVAVYAVVKTWAAIFRRQLQLLRLRTRAGHAVVCGLGDKGVLIATALRDRGDDVVVIEQDATAAGLAQCEERGCIGLVGDARDRELLQRARVDRAKVLIAVCREDGANAEVAARARDLLPARRRDVLGCLVHVGDLDLYHLIRERELPGEEHDALRLQCFNVFENGARALLRDHPVRCDGAAAVRPHVVVIGLGRFGESVVIHLARTWYAEHRGTDRRLRLTVVDVAAEAKTRALALRYRALTASTEVRAWETDVRSPEFQKAAFLADAGGRADVTQVYVCLRHEAAALAAALALRPRLREAGLGAVVRVGRDEGLAALLRQDGQGTDTGLAFFGLAPRACQLDLVVGGTNEMLARAIHADYVRNEAARGRTAADNASMVPWDELPEVLRESNRAQAHHIGVKLRAIGCRVAPLTDWSAPVATFSAADVERMARLEHERWMAERRAAGWTPGATKRLERQETPYLVPWEDLAEEIRELDRTAVRAIPELLARTGYRIARVGPGDPETGR